MAAVGEDFEDWLRGRLEALDLDGDVFTSYVMGVLSEDDTNEEETRDALHGILEGMTEHNVEDICSELMDKWHKNKGDDGKKETEKCTNGVDKGEKLVAAMLETKVPAMTKNTPQNKPSNTIDSSLKQQMVMMYSQQSDDEDEDNQSVNTGEDSNKDTSLFKNTNVGSIFENEKAKREKMKQENEKKKQKDKEDREKQKQKVDERKDKEKKRTQKGEKRAR